MKYRNFLLSALIFISLSGFSQGSNPYNLSFAVSKTNYKAGDTIDFIINFKIADGWELYSSEFPADGPIKFECTLEKSSDYTQLGTIIPYKPYTHYDEVWESQVKIFEKIAQFRLTIIVKKPGKINLKAALEGQFCKDACVAMSEKVDLELSSLPLGDNMAAEPSVYFHFGKEPEDKKQKPGNKTKQRK